jgi:hypothetical protein
VRGKLFAQLDDHHHGADHLAVWLPAPLGEQEAMIFQTPRASSGRPTSARAAGSGVRIDRRPNWTVLTKLVEQAYGLVGSTSEKQEGKRGTLRGCPYPK